MKKLVFTALAVGLSFTASFMAQVPNYVPTNGLAAWYSFTGNANDESGGNNNGNISGAILTSGKLGLTNTAYRFDGSSSSINLSNAFIGGTQVNEFTFHVLLKFDTTNLNQYIWSKTLFWGEVGFAITNQNEISFGWANSITGNKYSFIKSQPSTINSNIWYDIVVTYQNASAQIYLNGNPIITNLTWSAQGGSILSNSQIESSCNFEQDPNSSNIGTYLNTEYMNGIIDEFGVWSRALDSTEVSDLYLGSTVGISDPNTLSDVQIYPNPSNDHITIDAGNLATMNGYSIKIEDAQGQQVFQNAVNQQQFYVDITTWGGNGLYFVRIIDPQGNTVDIKKIVLQ
jgi:hypothetical protein